MYVPWVGTKLLGSGILSSAPAPRGATQNLSRSAEMSHPTGLFIIHWLTWVIASGSRPRTDLATCSVVECTMKRDVEAARQLDHDGARCRRVRRADELYRFKALRVIVTGKRQSRLIGRVAEQCHDVDEPA